MFYKKKIKYFNIEMKIILFFLFENDFIKK